MKVKTITIITRFAMLIAIAIVIDVTDASAQRGPQVERGARQDGPPRERPIPDSIDVTQMVNRLSKELSLTETQQTEVEALYQTHFTMTRSEMKDVKKAKVAQREEHQQIRKELENDVKSVLNDDQVEKFDEIIERRKNGPKGKRRHRSKG